MVATVELTVKIANAETMSVLASKTVKFTKFKVIQETSSSTSEGNFAEGVVQDAIQGAASDVTDEIMELAFPVKILKVSGKSVIINIAKERSKKGMLLVVLKPGEELIDPDTGESLGASEEEIGRVQITQVSPKTSSAIPIGELKIKDLEVGMLLRKISKEDLLEEQEGNYQATQTTFKNKF